MYFSVSDLTCTTLKDGRIVLLHRPSFKDTLAPCWSTGSTKGPNGTNGTNGANIMRWGYEDGHLWTTLLDRKSAKNKNSTHESTAANQQASLSDQHDSVEWDVWRYYVMPPVPGVNHVVLTPYIEQSCDTIQIIPWTPLYNADASASTTPHMYIQVVHGPTTVMKNRVMHMHVDSFGWCTWCLKSRSAFPFVQLTNWKHFRSHMIPSKLVCQKLTAWIEQKRSIRNHSPQQPHSPLCFDATNSTNSTAIGEHVGNAIVIGEHVDNAIVDNAIANGEHVGNAIVDNAIVNGEHVGNAIVNGEHVGAMETETDVDHLDMEWDVEPLDGFEEMCIQEPFALCGSFVPTPMDADISMTHWSAPSSPDQTSLIVKLASPDHLYHHLSAATCYTSNVCLSPLPELFVFE